jgi:hypothetical protein
MVATDTEEEDTEPDSEEDGLSDAGSVRVPKQGGGGDSSGSSSTSSGSSRATTAPSSDKEDQEEDEPAVPAHRPKKAHPVTPLAQSPKAHRKRARHEDRQQQFLDAFVALSSKNLKIALRANKKAAGATGSPASKLSAIQMEWLEACAGHEDDQMEFQRPPIYDELEAAGGTKDAALTVLRRRCVEVKGTRHKCRVHVTSKMAATLKTGNFSAGNDRTFDGCTAGVTLFAVPQLSQKQAHEDTLERQSFEEATHRSQADNKKYLAGQRFLPPTSLVGVLRNLNNYICWTESMFGGDCPHLLMVVRLRDALDDNEDALEVALCRYLRMSILWKVHEDARQFFDACEKWSRGEPMPRSKLRGMVHLIKDDQMVSRSITCPFDEFFADDKKDKKEKAPKGSGGGGAGAQKEKDAAKKRKQEPQPTSNPSLLPLCAAAVKNTVRRTLTCPSHSLRPNRVFPSTSLWSGARADAPTTSCWAAARPCVTSSMSHAR